MKLPVIRRLDKQDLVGKGDMPGWMDSFISVLNGFIEPVAKALQSRLTFTDNFLCKVTTQTFKHGTELLIGVEPTLKVLGVLPVLAINGKSGSSGISTGVDSMLVSLKGNGQLGVTINFISGAGVSADVTLIILYG